MHRGSGTYASASAWIMGKRTKTSTTSSSWSEAMASIVRPGDGFVYMKVGTHAQEKLADIVSRKRREIEEAGFALWGYGGSTCHPLSMVQPFAREFVKKSGRIYLCMQPMDSKHFAEKLRASKFSVDGI